MPPAQRKGIKFLDAKVLIATLSLAITIGLWNLFSIDAVKAEQIDPPALASDLPDGAASQSQELPPLPTIVPLVELQELPAPAINAPVSQAQANPALAAPTGKLRSVAAPPVTIVQKNKPLVDAPVVGGGGGGGGGGQSSRRSAARSRSS